MKSWIMAWRNTVGVMKSWIVAWRNTVGVMKSWIVACMPELHKQAHDDGMKEKKT